MLGFEDWHLFDQHVFSPAAGNNVEVDESLFQDIEDLDLDEDDPDFDPLEMGSDEDWNRTGPALLWTLRYALWQEEEWWMSVCQSI